MVSYEMLRARATPYFRAEASPPALSSADAERWTELRPLMMDGPARTVRVSGAIASVEPGRTAHVTRVWIDGDKVRLEHEGSPVLVTDGRQTWHFRADAAPLLVPRRSESHGDGRELAFRRTEQDVELFDFGQPLGPFVPVEHLGRPAWSFAFWPPRSKPAQMHVVVDAATGLVLHQHFADTEHHVEWVELDEVDTQPAELFTWSGPAQTEAELRVEQEIADAKDLADRARWFRDHVTNVPLAVRGQLDVLVNRYSPDGRFYATLRGPFDGGLTRRPRAGTRWRTGMSKVDHGWTDERWDWAVSVWDDELTADEVATLQRQLGTRPLT